MSKEVLPLDSRAEKIAIEVAKFTKDGKEKLSIFDKSKIMNLEIKGEQDSHSRLSSAVMYDMESLCRRLNSMRNGTHEEFGVTDISFAEAVKSMYGFESVNDFLRIGLGIEPSRITSEKLWSKPEYNQGYRWLIQEIILEAMKLGIRKPSMHEGLVANTVSLSQPEAKMPTIDMADAMPSVIGEGDTLKMGSLSFDQKTVNTFKLGIGLKTTDEVIKYVSLDMVSMFLADMPVRMNNALDALFIAIAINGNQTGEEAPIIGVKTTGAWAYRDLTRMWARGARMGRDFTCLMTDEETALDLLDLEEFRGYDGPTTRGELMLKTNIPTKGDLMIHGAIAENTIMALDKNAAMVKLMVEAMSLESERIVQNGISATYLKTRIGFAKMFQDAVVLINNAITYNKTAGQVGGFPVYMDPKPIETSVLRGRSAM
jgi:hypothetical protein